jgi:hypothetical protein
MQDSSSSLHPILDLGLKDLVRHDMRHHGNSYTLFCDAFSQFGVAFPALNPLGIGPLCPKATLSTYHVSLPTLELSLREGDHVVAVQRQNLECLPWMTTERAQLAAADGVLDIEAQHIFADERTLRSRFVFTNRSSGAQTFRPEWMGRVSDEQQSYMLSYFHGKPSLPRVGFLETSENGITGGLKIARAGDDLPQVGIRIQTSAQALQASINDLGWVFDGSITLDPGASAEFEFALAINFIADGSSDFIWKETPASETFADLIKRARTRFAGNINLDKPPQTAGIALAAQAWRARYTLLRDGYRGLDGVFGDELACLCTSDNTDFSCVFFWDTLFSSVAISDFNPAYARGAIRTAFVGHDDRDGSSPERKFNYTVQGRMAQQSPQSPVASWAVRSYLDKNDDPEFLREMFPILVRNHAFWETYSDTDRDGLAEYRWSGQICDNSPLWDPYTSFDHGSGCGFIPPVASVALNSFLFWDANHLAELATRLGQTEEAARYKGRAAQLEKDLFAVCFVPEEHRFWDYDHHTRQHRKVKTFYMFWPLFAGMNVPEETKKSLFGAMLDPKQFFGDVPFPSVAYDEPTYKSTSYWRGRTWPHISYWLIQTLVRHGYDKEAKIAAQRTLAAWSRSAGFPENVPSQIQHLEAAGFADYNWGCAAAYLFATESYLNS